MMTKKIKELRQLGFFTSYLFLAGAAIFLYMWLFGARPTTLFTKIIPVDSLSNKKSFPIDSIILPKDLKACEIELSADGLKGEASDYTTKYTTLITAEIADDADKPAGEMEAELYYDYGSGWVERKDKEKKYFQLAKSGTFNIDLFLDRQRGLSKFMPSTIYKDSVQNGVIKNVFVNKMDTINIPQPNAKVTLKISTPDSLLADNAFWGLIVMGVIGGSILITLKDGWSGALMILFLVGFVAFFIWMDS